MRARVIRVDNSFFVPPFTERKEVTMRNADISGYLMRALIVLLVAGITAVPVLGEQQEAGNRRQASLHSGLMRDPALAPPLRTERVRR